MANDGRYAIKANQTKLSLCHLFALSLNVKQFYLTHW